MRYAFFCDGRKRDDRVRCRVLDNDAQEVGRTAWHPTAEEAKVEARELVKVARKAAELVDAAGVN